MVYIQTLTGAVFDNFPRTNKRKTLVTLSVCIIGFLLGLVCVTQVCIYSGTCQYPTSFVPTFVFRIERYCVYTG